VTEEEKSSCRGGEQEEEEQEPRVAMMGFKWTVTECSSVSFQSLSNKCSPV
jgi:hypothetical protein